MIRACFKNATQLASSTQFNLHEHKIYASCIRPIKNSFVRMKTLIRIIVLLAISYHSTFAQVTPNDLQVTYIANEGFLIKSKNHKILIDALFTNVFAFFSSPTPEVVKQMMDASAPFDSVDLYFLTHYHKDHLDSKLIKDYLKKYPIVKIVTTKPSLVFIDGDQFGFIKLKKQFCEITPEVNQSISQTINNVPIKVLGLKHLSFIQNDIDLEEYMFNAGFYINLDGIKIFHSGDAKIDNLKDYVAKNGQWKDPVDVAFVYYDMLHEGKTDLDYLVKTLNPKYIVIMHLPPSFYKEWSEKIAQLKQVFPNITLFNNSLESQLFKFK
jgi:L-ascorbate metabolism protein UlaG (beta-lactamase superfamily)